MIYDIIGIGIGPFNLGLAALAAEIPNLKCLFADKNGSFDWHPGLMIDGTRLQVPFYADLVTLANPCSKYSYLAFLKHKQRLFRFAIHENYFPTRKEYIAYCQWVVGQLTSLQFGRTCSHIHYDEIAKIYTVCLRDNKTRNTKIYYSKNIVVGIGTVPSMPKCAEVVNSKNIFHSAEYLFRKEGVLKTKNICIIGSGQSAAEIFNDLLPHRSKVESLSWFTRSDRFYPMEYSRLTLEMTSPDYMDYFFELPVKQKKMVLAKQNALYKGINFSLVNEIYDRLYLDSLDDEPNNNIILSTSLELKEIQTLENRQVQVSFRHTISKESIHRVFDTVILATGYKNIIPGFLEPVREYIRWNGDNNYDLQKNYAVSKEGNSIFVQNADSHTHGFNSADLGMGPYRNAVIINTVMNCEYFVLENNIAFQTFGVPEIK